MQVIENAQDLKKFRKSLDSDVGFVPTMGALHEGHKSLIKRSIEQNPYTIVSVYVNPTQFLEGEDLDQYPKDVEADIKICEDLGVDALFLPQNLYTKDEISLVAPKVKGYVLEGHFRPGHFNGVLSVVMKLLNIVNPQKAYFGKKDAQQYILIRQMAKDLFLDTKIIGLPTLRDEDGLAKSSRNIYLNPLQRKKALSLYKSLQFIQNNINSLSFEQLTKEIYSIIELDELQYIAFTDYKLQKIKQYKKDDTLVTMAGFLGTTRLIDNLWL